MLPEWRPVSPNRRERATPAQQPLLQRPSVVRTPLMRPATKVQESLMKTATMVRGDQRGAMLESPTTVTKALLNRATQRITKLLLLQRQPLATPQAVTGRQATSSSSRGRDWITRVMRWPWTATANML